MSNLPQKDHTPPANNLSGYQAKINLLKQIDDAASNYGGDSRAGSGLNQSGLGNRLNKGRNQEAVRTANLILGSKNNAGLKANDLESLNGQNNHRTADNDLRSIKSEYDYGSKKKFVDVLGNIKKTNQNGLKGLEGL